MSKNKSVNIILETLIKQDGDISKHSVKSIGNISEKDDRKILEFVEESTEGDFHIRFDLMNSGDILLNRQSTNRQSMSDFWFKENSSKDVIYKTPFGTMNMISETKQIVFDHDEENSEILKIEYILKNGKELVGEYKLRLIFGA